MFAMNLGNFFVNFDNGWMVSIHMAERIRAVTDAAMAGKDIGDILDGTYADDVEVAIIRSNSCVRDDALFYHLKPRQLLRLMALAQALPDRDFRMDEFPITEEMLDYQYALRRVKTPV